MKNATGFWREVVPGNERGEHDIEGEERERITEISESLKHLTSDKPVTSSDTERNFGLQVPGRRIPM